MALSVEAQRCLDAVTEATSLTAKSTCTSVQDDLVALLAAGGGLPANGPGVRDGVYTLRAQPAGQAQAWQHAATVVRAGGTPCIYQGWVSRYTLDEWIRVTPSGGCHDCALNFSPNSELVQGDAQRQLDVWLDLVLRLKSAYSRGDWDGFSGAALAAFGVTLGGKDQMVVRSYENYAFTLDWVHYKLKPAYAAETVAIRIGGDGGGGGPAARPSKCCF